MKPQPGRPSLPSTHWMEISSGVIVTKKTAMNSGRAMNLGRDRLQRGPPVSRHPEVRATIGREPRRATATAPQQVAVQGPFLLRGSPFGLAPQDDGSKSS